MQCAWQAQRKRISAAPRGLHAHSAAEGGARAKVASSPRAWALSHARSVREEREARDDAVGESGSEEEEEEEGESMETGAGEEEAMEGSSVEVDGAGRAFLKDMGEMEEVQVSSCTHTPSSRADSGADSESDVQQGASHSSARKAHGSGSAPLADEKHECTDVGVDTRMDAGSTQGGEGAEGRGVRGVGREQEDGGGGGGGAVLDPAEEFKRAVLARGRGRSKKWMSKMDTVLQTTKAQEAPSCAGGTAASRGAQEEDESSSEVAPFADAMGACDTQGRYVPRCWPRRFCLCACVRALGCHASAAGRVQLLRACGACCALL